MFISTTMISTLFKRGACTFQLGQLAEKRMQPVLHSLFCDTWEVFAAGILRTYILLLHCHDMYFEKKVLRF